MNTLDKATTLQDAFSALQMGDVIEIQVPGGRLQADLWIPFSRTGWGFSEIRRPGQYNNKVGMISQREFSRYPKWRKLTDYNRNLFNL